MTRKRMESQAKTEPSRGGRPSVERAAEIGAKAIGALFAVYAEQGLDFSMDDLARRAGVSKQAIYRRWPSKMALLEHALDVGVAAVVEERRRGVPEDRRLALRQMAWQAFVHDQTSSGRIMAFLMADAQNNEYLRSRMPRWLSAIAAPVREVIHELVGDDGASAATAEDLAEMLMDLMNGAGQRALLLGGLCRADQDAVFETRWRSFLRMAGIDAPEQVQVSA